MTPEERKRQEQLRVAYVWLNQYETKKQIDLMTAVQLWVDANKALQQGNIREYFIKADELNRYMSQQKLSPDDLRPLVAGIDITPASFSRLTAIYGAASNYGRGAATLEDSTVETSFVSAIAKTTAFFMDCRLGKNERAIPDESLEVSVRDITIDIMKHIQRVASPGICIGKEDLNELMSKKIRAVERLLDDNPERLEAIYALKILHVNLDRPITSTVNIKESSLDDRSLQADWIRELEQDHLLINGIPLGKIAADYGKFESKELVTQFFEEVILEDFQGSDAQKKGAVDYLSNAFHQGGLLKPVSSAIATQLFVDEKNENHGIPMVSEYNINIQTTQRGFVIQELCSYNSVLTNAQDKLLGNFVNAEGGQIQLHVQDDTFKPLIKAEGTIEVDFSKCQNNPFLTVKSNTIEINHPGLAKHADKRNFLQKFIDGFKALFGLNKVEHIAAMKESLHEGRAQEARTKARHEDTEERHDSSCDNSAS